MSIKISYKKGISEKVIRNYVLFSNEEFKINGLNKLSLSKNSNQINKTIKSNKGKNKNFLSFKFSLILNFKIKIDNIRKNGESIPNCLARNTKG